MSAYKKIEPYRVEKAWSKTKKIIIDEEGTEPELAYHFESDTKLRNVVRYIYKWSTFL
ncbi:hypothetical protein [Fodinibius saliphilus]|uniref:hypothetical protein n=1 Tax=Fodinibius saliphilus TaxID=1920650 RepID=UPI001486C349|nr:hypothetical protein [Fodinibius saliphilus]